MIALFEQLKQTRALWILFFVAVPLIFLSKWSQSYWGLVLLDGISDPDAARILLSELTPHQNVGHLWFTTTLDVILPFAAAGLFASAILAFFGRFGVYLAMIPLFAVPLDLTEGVVQVLALTNTADLLEIKAYTTPVKSMCYKIGFWLSFAGLVKWLLFKLKSMVAS